MIWDDATIDTGHEASLDDPVELGSFGGMSTCRDIGFLVSIDKEVVVLAVGSTDTTIRHSNTVPTGWVREIIYLPNPFEKT